MATRGGGEPSQWRRTDVEVAGVGRDTRRVGVRIDGADLHVDLALVHLRRVDGLVLHDHHILRVAAHATLVLLLLCAVRCKGQPRQHA